MNRRSSGGREHLSAGEGVEHALVPKQTPSKGTEHAAAQFPAKDHHNNNRSHRAPKPRPKPCPRPTAPGGAPQHDPRPAGVPGTRNHLRQLRAAQRERLDHLPDLRVVHLAHHLLNGLNRAAVVVLAEEHLGRGHAELEPCGLGVGGWVQWG